MTRPPRLGVSRRVFSKRNSEFNVPLEWLDQSRWWMDAWQTDAWRYLHVQGLASADPTGKYDLASRVFRVYPRKLKGRTKPITLKFKDGVLFWCYGPTPEEKARHDAWSERLYAKEEA
jgi:hypothetical protein